MPLSFIRVVTRDNLCKISGPDLGASEVIDRYKFLSLSFSHSCLQCLLHYSLQYCHNVLMVFHSLFFFLNSSSALLFGHKVS